MMWKRSISPKKTAKKVHQSTACLQRIPEGIPAQRVIWSADMIPRRQHRLGRRRRYCNFDISYFDISELRYFDISCFDISEVRYFDITYFYISEVRYFDISEVRCIGSSIIRYIGDSTFRYIGSSILRYDGSSTFRHPETFDSTSTTLLVDSTRSEVPGIQ